MKALICGVLLGGIFLIGNWAEAVGKEQKRVPSSTTSFVVKPCQQSESAPTSTEFVNTFRTFSQGAVRVFEMDTYGEPACCSSHLIVYFPAKTEPMMARCFHIASNEDGLGFSAVDLAKAKSSYNPKDGLTLRMPFTFYVDGIKDIQRSAEVVINRDKETVIVR
jgi:hypothetical protein